MTVAAPVPARPQRSPWGPWLVALLAAAAHLVVGFFSVLSGLAVPFVLLAPVWVLWVALAFVLQKLAIRRSWWTPAVPAAAAAALAVSTLISTALGFTA